jgi:TRAP-type C4-dicarboxylate transport system permease small subunit
MHRVIAGIDWLSAAVARVTMGAVVLAAGAMMAALILQVFSRYVLGATFVWTEELALLLFTWIVLLGASVGIREDGHVRLGMLVDALPPLPRAVWHRLVMLLVLVFCLILLSSGMDYLARTTGRLSAAIRYPIEWLHAAAPVAGALGALHAVARLLRPAPESPPPASGPAP